MDPLTVEERLFRLEDNMQKLLNFFGVLAVYQRDISTLSFNAFSAMDEARINGQTLAPDELVPVPTPALEPVLTEQPPVPQIPEEGWLDCESYVLGRLGSPDMRMANLFGQALARAGIARGLQPKKIIHPGEHWREVNTWPIEFLREIWYMSFGGTP